MVHQERLRLRKWTVIAPTLLAPVGLSAQPAAVAEKALKARRAGDIPCYLEEDSDWRRYLVLCLEPSCRGPGPEWAIMGGRNL